MRVRSTVQRVMAVGLSCVMAMGIQAPAGAEASERDARAAQAQAEATLAQVEAVREGRATGDLTLLLRDLWFQRDALSGASFAQADDQFGRPTNLPDTVDTPNFRLHHDANPASENHTTPAFLQLTGQVFEESLANQIAQGWQRPADDGTRGGDNRIDIYLSDQLPGLFGFASVDNDATCVVDRCAGLHGWMGMDNDYAGFSTSPEDSLRATTAHEFHHLIQFAEAPLADAWFFEATATWQESVVFPDADARSSYIEAFSIDPTQPLTTADGEHEYAMYVFMLHLASRYDVAGIIAMWRATLDAGQHALAGIDVVARAAGSSFSEEFADFASGTAFWNEGGFPSDVVDGSPVTYPDVARAGTLRDGDSVALTLDHTGFALHDLPAADRMGARVTGDPSVDGAVTIVASGPDDVIRATAQMVDGVATASLPDVAGRSVTVGVVNSDLEVSGGGAGSPFDYAADNATFCLAVSSDIVGDAPPPVTVQDALVDCGRVAGDGPVAQSVATSQALFPDGTAQQVIVATSDRFPDALAGAALASDNGPILLTPFGESLDPRIAAEIARVTGGDAMVLVLGGSTAVSDSAAAEARALAGDVPCLAPFPDTCRYAGSGREETATLIADTVQAINQLDTVLIARGDEFADAITGGAFAARSGVAVLLTPPRSANAFTQAWLDAHPEVVRVVVLGGTAAIDDPTFAALGATQRVAGADRTETSQRIAEELWAPSGNDSGGIVLVNVRAADGWAGALTASVASAFFDAPQLGVENPPQGLSASVADHLAGVDGPVQAFGSTDLVSDAVLVEAQAARG